MTSASIPELNNVRIAGRGVHDGFAAQIKGSVHDHRNARAIFEPINQSPIGSGPERKRRLPGGPRGAREHLLPTVSYGRVSPNPLASSA